METFSALLAICAENSPVPGEFTTQRPVTWSFDVFFDLRLNKRLSKQWWGWWFETLSCQLWRHLNVPMRLLHCTRANIWLPQCPLWHVIKWKHLPHYWPSARRIHQSLDSPHKGPVMQSFGFSFYVCRNNLLSKQFICWWFKMAGHLGELQYSKDPSKYVAYLMVYTISWQAQFETIEHQCHMKIAKVAHCMSYTYSQYSSYCAYTQHDVLHVLGF